MIKVIMHENDTAYNLYRELQYLCECYIADEHKLHEVISERSPRSCGKYFVFVNGGWNGQNDLVWVGAIHTADKQNFNKSALELSTPQITLEEAIALEIQFFNITQRHCDINSATLCAGSRHVITGEVPVLYFDGKRVCIKWAEENYHDKTLRSRNVYLTK